MKKLTLFILMFCLFFLSGCTQNKKPVSLLDTIKLRDRIIVGIKSDSKPFGFLQNGEIAGFDADIAKEIAKNLFNSDFKGHIQFVPLAPSERITALNTGKVDIVVATLSINERRKEIIDFSTPYFMAGQALMVPKSSRITNISQLNDRPAAIVLGTTGEKTIRLLAPNSNVIGVQSYKEAFTLLKNGEVDAILADDSLLYGLLTRGYKIPSPRYTREFYAVGIKKGDDTLNLKKKINAILKDMEQTGKISRIKEKWIPNSYK